MGRDYRHRLSKFDRYEDGYEIFKDKKLPSYDRNKNRKQNKINLNQFDLPPEDDSNEFFDEDLNEEE
jgi:hypothetical protein